MKKKKQSGEISFSFLKTNFEDLGDDGRAEYFSHAWRECKLSGKTSFLESFSSGRCEHVFLGMGKKYEHEKVNIGMKKHIKRP